MWQLLINKKNRGVAVLAGLFLLLGFYGSQTVLSQEGDPMKGAVLFFSPEKKTISEKEEFVIWVRLVNNGDWCNCAQAEILFDPELLMVEGIIKENSVFKLWPKEPQFDNSKGILFFQGGVTGQGLKGTGTLFGIVFKAKADGQASLVFNSARVLAADSRGTDILKTARPAVYQIQEESATRATAMELDVASETIIRSPTHPDPTVWYNNSSPVLEWPVNTLVQSLRWGFDLNPWGEPVNETPRTTSQRFFSGVKDGTWYFHLQLKENNVWGTVNHYRVHIDTTAPDVCEIAIDNQGDATNPNLRVYLNGADDTSGIIHYELLLNEQKVQEGTSIPDDPVSFFVNRPGEHTLKMQLLDWAGNLKECSSTFNVEPLVTPEITIWPQNYQAGAEKFYIEGTAAPHTVVNVALSRSDFSSRKAVANWEIKADDQGRWFFSTDRLFKPGRYYLSAFSQDERGARSNPSEEKSLQVTLAGAAIGQWLMDYKSISLVLTFLTILVAAVIIYLYRFKVRRARMETKDAFLKMKTHFEHLRTKAQKSIEDLDQKPGLSLEEQKLKDDLMQVIRTAEQELRREIKDIEKALR